MSRRKKRKRGAKSKKQSASSSSRVTRTSQQPNETFTHGPIQMARFGKLVVIQNNMTPEQQSEFMAGLATRYPEICTKINDLVVQAIAIVRAVDPLDLLRQGYWITFLAHCELRPEESKTETEQIVAREMTNYVLKLIVGAGSERTTDHATVEQVKALQEIVGEIYRIYQSEFPLIRTAFNQQKDDYDPEVDEFVTRAELGWMFVQGDRYQYHDAIHIPELLQNQDSLLQETWGVSVADITHGIKSIQHSLSKGVQDAFSHLQELHKKFIELSDANPGKALNAVAELLKEQSDTTIDEQAFSSAFEFGLFDVEDLTGWPGPFIEDLSVTPGQDSDFLGHKQRGGWPNQSTMCHEHPFIRVRGRSYVFNQHLCMDILYRSIQRALLHRHPKLNEKWNQRQKSISESLALELVERVLPRCSRYESIHYQYMDKETGEDKWAECDGVLLIDNNLIVIEVKAGAFTTKPPYVHYKSHINSLRKLIRDPVDQGRRFLNALNAASRLTIHNKRRQPIVTLLDRFDSTSIICVTLDQLTDISPQIEHLRDVGVDTAEHPVWPVSIDDLRVVTNIFNSPVHFMHFLQERNRAFTSSSVRINDELDHVGAYLVHNHYSKFAEAFPNKSLRGWGGYRDRIDQYYSDLFLGNEDPRHPVQDLPTELADILRLISMQQKSGYITVGKRLLDGSTDSRTDVCALISEMRQAQAIQKRPRPISALGEWPLTIVANTEGTYSVDFSYARVHACADLQIQSDQDRLLLVLRYSLEGVLMDIDFELIDENTATEIGEKEISSVRQRLFQSRLRLAKKRTKHP